MIRHDHLLEVIILQHVEVVLDVIECDLDHGIVFWHCRFVSRWKDAIEQLSFLSCVVLLSFH